MALQIVTANRLNDGLVIFLTGEGWSTEIHHAATAEDKAAVAALLARAEQDPALAVGPYEIDVERTESGGLRPTKYREVLRTRGPSVRTDLGYQAA